MPTPYNSNVCDGCFCLSVVKLYQLNGVLEETELILVIVCVNYMITSRWWHLGKSKYTPFDMYFEPMTDNIVEEQERILESVIQSFCPVLI